jgi:hypothetical protein
MPSLFAPVAVALTFLTVATAQFVSPPFNAAYSLRTIASGVVPGLPQRYSGVAFDPGDHDLLLLAGAARTAQGGVYGMRVIRNGSGHIAGLAGTAVLVATAPDIDGGLAYTPSGVLLFTQDPSNGIGQILSGNTAPSRIVNLTPLGVAASTGGLAIVPAGYPGAGRLKITARNAWFDASLTADGAGTFNVVAPTQRVTLIPAAIAPVYLRPGSPLFANYSSILACEYSSGTVAAYDVDASGDPIPASRRLFAQNLVNVRGGTVDPATGDLLFVTNGAGNEIFVIERTAACGALTSYGNGTAGSGARVPTLTGSGCPTPGQTVTLTAGNGLASTAGLLLLGTRSTQIAVVGGIVLVLPDLQIEHRLDGAGAATLPIPIPLNNRLVGQNFFLQTIYFDLGAAGGFSMSRGLQLNVR